MKFVNWIAFVLVIVGGLNWGLIGVADIDLVTWLFGDALTLVNLVYILVGLSAIYLAVISPKLIK